jgi:hypothetical protein
VHVYAEGATTEVSDELEQELRGILNDAINREEIAARG